MSPRLLSLATVLLSAATLHAGDPGSSEPSATAVPAYQLQRKSNFTAQPEEKRAPFWPIGWVKRKAGTESVAVAAPVKVALDEKAFKVSSILLGNPSFAIINGRTYSEGEFLKLPRAATPASATAAPVPPTARIRIYRIDDGAVTLQHAEQLLTVMLKRPELQDKRGDEELLLEDRP